MTTLTDRIANATTAQMRDDLLKMQQRIATTAKFIDYLRESRDKLVVDRDQLMAEIERREREERERRRLDTFA